MHINLQPRMKKIWLIVKKLIAAKKSISRGIFFNEIVHFTMFFCAVINWVCKSHFNGGSSTISYKKKLSLFSCLNYGFSRELYRVEKIFSLVCTLMLLCTTAAMVRDRRRRNCYHRKAQIRKPKNVYKLNKL